VSRRGRQLAAFVKLPQSGIGVFPDEQRRSFGAKPRWHASAGLAATSPGRIRTLPPGIPVPASSIPHSQYTSPASVVGTLKKPTSRPGMKYIRKSHPSDAAQMLVWVSTGPSAACSGLDVRFDRQQRQRDGFSNGGSMVMRETLVAGLVLSALASPVLAHHSGLYRQQQGPVRRPSSAGFTRRIRARRHSDCHAGAAASLGLCTSLAARPLPDPMEALTRDVLCGGGDGRRQRLRHCRGREVR
jgi:hypothetical protein